MKNIGAFFSLFLGENRVGPQSILTDAYFFLCAACVDFFPTTTTLRFPLKKVEGKKSFSPLSFLGCPVPELSIFGTGPRGFFSRPIGRVRRLQFPGFFWLCVPLEEEKYIDLYKGEI